MLQPMGTVSRFDSASLDAPVRTPAGYLRVPAFLTRPGVFEYRDKSGNVTRELRHPDDVFSPESLATLAGVPVTNDHPSDADRVDSDSAHRYQAGSVGDTISTAGGKVTASLTITDKRLIQEIDAKKKLQVSAGYTMVCVPEAGEFEGKRYDSRQTQIVYNHVAVVERGRAGSDVRLRMDSDAVLVDDGEANTYNQEDTQEACQDGNMTDEQKKSAEATEAKAKADAQAKQDAAQVKQDAADVQARKDAQEVQARLDSEKARADALEIQIKDLKAQLDPANLAKLVSERATLVATAEKHGVRVDSATAAVDVKRAVVEKLMPGLAVKEGSADYVNAAYDIALKAAEAAPATGFINLAQQVASQNRGDAVSPYEAMVQRNQNAYKQGASK